MRDVDEILTDLLTLDGKEDLGALYAELHTLGEVHRSKVLGRVVTSHRTCDAVLRDSRAVKTRETGRSGLPGSGEHASRRLIDSTFLMVDPPDHTRLRRLVSKAFTPRAVSGLQPAVETVLAGLLDTIAARAADGAEIDLMTELAFPFPVAVIGSLLGVPAADRPQFQGLVRDLTAALDLFVDDAALAVADRAALDVLAYFEGLVAERRRRPADDLTTALIAAREEGDRLSEDELLSTLTLLFLAGFETTTNLIGNGMLALLTHPGQFAALRADPAGLPAAVEELLRFESPVQVVPRVSAGTIMLATGDEVPPDRYLVVLLGAANRDPRVFAEPDRLRLDRAGAATLSFGSGIHYCLGAGLARMEARLLFGELMRRFPTIEPAGPPQRRASVTVRGLNRLPLRLRASSGPPSPARSGAAAR